MRVDRITAFYNPFLIEFYGAVLSVRYYRAWLLEAALPEAISMRSGPQSKIWKMKFARNRNTILKALPSLQGKNLACWCKLEEPCHADILLAIANCEVNESDQLGSWHG
jgi:hypothetical protein